MRKEKKPIKASVTAAMAAIRAAPNDFTKSKKPCTGVPYPAGGANHAPHPARFAQFKVSARLIRRAIARKNKRLVKADTNGIRRPTRRRSASAIGESTDDTAGCVSYAGQRDRAD